MNMIKMWNVTIKNLKTGEQARVVVPGHNATQAKTNARKANQQLLTDPFAQISFQDIEYAGFEIPQTALD